MGFLQIKNLVHDFMKIDENGNTAGTLRALDDVTLEVERGSFVAILGHNGSGKSTLAKHINALLLPTSGDVVVAKKNTKQEEEVLFIRQEAGMVFQNPDNQMIANVVEEEVAFGPENIGVPTEDIWARVEDCLQRVGMLAYRLHSPNRLSGGQKQRVAIAGVLAMKPSCIILDEPTAMLDPRGRREVIATLRELNQKEHITVILITHNMEETVDVDQLFVMDDARIVMQGTPREVFGRVEELRALHLNVPVATELAYELRKGGLALPLGVLTNEELIDKLCEEEKLW